MLNTKLCPNPVSLGIQVDSKKPVSILSISDTLGNTTFCTFRPVSKQTIVCLEKYLLSLKSKKDL